MSITNPQVIDIWLISTWEPNNVVLIISDHLEWGDKTQQGEHLQLLQDKINTYVAFIESREIYTEIPGALGKSPIIRINGLYELPEQGERFTDRAAKVLKEAGIGLEFVLDGNEAIRNL
ncbi:hypothetical protein PCAU_2296 [Pseudomonas chlororaphis subsp. aurantiaca]|uniref:DUF6572 domain-containing protein n=1 Tax=Pseudomonas chlororaphis TaxID=587753 RepID=UPI000865EF3D|nr:DUF6572 domain-containing protein [Pseudomonas chlororaphis]BAV74505.1 hypothetical protein PCAU_2296 [Pseudomonas chlororaphis subsp. aurantiaca]